MVHVPLTLGAGDCPVAGIFIDLHNNQAWAGLIAGKQRHVETKQKKLSAIRGHGRMKVIVNILTKIFALEMGDLPKYNKADLPFQPITTVWHLICKPNPAMNDGLLTGTWDYHQEFVHFS